MDYVYHPPTARELAIWHAQDLADQNKRAAFLFAIFVAVILLVGWLLWRYRGVIRQAIRTTVVLFAATLLRVWRRIVAKCRALQTEIIQRAE